MKYQARRTTDLSGKTYGMLTVVRRRDDLRGTGSRDYRWDCLCDCGKTTVVPTGRLNSGRTTSCGCYLRKKGLAWRSTNKDGYVLIRRPEHPNARSNGSIFEHTFVMSEHLERPLFPHENVHHKNGVRDDNRIENLELWSTSQPKGQRVEDKIEWALDFLVAYGYGVDQNTGDAKASRD